MFGSIGCGISLLIDVNDDEGSLQEDRRYGETSLNLSARRNDHLSNSNLPSLRGMVGLGDERLYCVVVARADPAVNGRWWINVMFHANVSL